MTNSIWAHTIERESATEKKSRNVARRPCAHIDEDIEVDSAQWAGYTVNRSVEGHHLRSARAPRIGMAIGEQQEFLPRFSLRTSDQR